MIGYDFDGTISKWNGWSKWQLKLLNIPIINEVFITIYSLTRPVLKRPTGRFVIISSRMPHHTWITKLWCWIHGIKPVDIMHVGHAIERNTVPMDKQMAELKVYLCNLYDCETFYDDNEEVCFWMKKLSPRLDIIQVKDGSIVSMNGWKQ